MTMEKEKKRSMFFWKKSHSHHSLGQQTQLAVEGTSNPNEVTFQPDQGSEFVEKDVNMGSVFMPFVKNYVSNLSHNKSPTKLPYPPNFYYPASSLQHQMNLQMQNIDLLIRANSLATPLERFISVLRYSLSTCSLTKFPYKPIIAFLGETDQSYTTHTDGTTTDTTYYVGEQVEREPSTCAFYISNPVRGVYHDGNVALVPKFKQAHVHVTFVGQRRTVLKHPQGAYEEVYVSDVPDLMIRLLRMHTELGGVMNLSCEQTGYAASIQFKDKPIFGGVKNGISGKVTLHGREVYQIEGTWDEVAYLVDATTRERFELLNRATLPKLKVESYPLEQQPETSGEKNWGVLIDALHRQEFEQARTIKQQIDAQHHERLASFETNPFVPSFFTKTAANTWQITNPNIIGVQQGGGMATM